MEYLYDTPVSIVLAKRVKSTRKVRPIHGRLEIAVTVSCLEYVKANFKRYNTAPYQINKIMKMNINNSKSEANNSKGESNGSLSSPLTASPVSNRSSLSPSSSLSLLVISNLSPNGESFSATNLGPSALKSLSLKKSKLSSKVGSNLSSKNNTGISFIPRLLSSSKLSPFVEKNKENVPLFGGDYTILEKGATIRELMLPIYENADAYDVIKIGVLCINDRLYENYPYNLILKKCQQNLDNLVPSSEISERISKRINEISDISDIKEAERVIKSWHNNDELFSDDFDASILNFIRNLFEKIWRFFGLESRYWDFNHTEGHISSALMFETFFNLFYDKNYAVEAQKELFANKERRNQFKTLSDNLLRALIPDITVTNLEYDVEFLIVEHGKLLSLNDKKKELGNTAKSCTMLHDMIRRIHNNLTFCDSQSVQEFENFRVIAVVTSALEIKVFTLNLAGKELYIFQQIAGCILPSRVQMYNSQLLRDNIITLIKIRKIIIGSIPEKFKFKIHSYNVPSFSSF